MGFTDEFGSEMGKEAAGCLSSGVGWLIVLVVVATLLRGC